VHHGTNHARADEIQVLRNTVCAHSTVVPHAPVAAYVLPPISSFSASDSRPYARLSPLFAQKRTPVALSTLSRLALPTRGLR
jgi:hypothetical protein